MNPIFRNILAVIAGIVVGGLINGGIISISGSVIPPPPGVNVATEEGLKAGIHLFKPINFLMPFLAHALGTLSGAYTAALVATKASKFLCAMIISFVFLTGGIMMVIELPSPVWFAVADLVFAYFPMAWLAAFISP